MLIRSQDKETLINFNNSIVVNTMVDIGDYIIRGVHGEFYPCKPDIFRETYEEVEA